MGAKLQGSHGLGESQDVIRNPTGIDPMLMWISDEVEKLGTGGRGTNTSFDALTLIIAVANFCYFWVNNILSFWSCPLGDLFVDYKFTMIIIIIVTLVEQCPQCDRAPLSHGW